MGMSIGGSSSSMQVSGAGMYQQQRQNFNQLAQSLQSGDLSAAKDAFSTLAAKSPNASDPNSPLGKLGAALQSGDVKAAQQAFSTLRSGSHHHHHNAEASASSGASPTPQLATSGSVGTNVNTVA
ncbi:MAG: hypothetical protein ACXV8Q_19905 [Methylobacter sp.]